MENKLLTEKNQILNQKLEFQISSLKTLENEKL